MKLKIAALLLFPLLCTPFFIMGSGSSRSWSSLPTIFQIWTLWLMLVIGLAWICPDQVGGRIGPAIRNWFLTLSRPNLLRILVSIYVLCFAFAFISDDNLFLDSPSARLFQLQETIEREIETEIDREHTVPRSEEWKSTVGWCILLAAMIGGWLWGVVGFLRGRPRAGRLGLCVYLAATFGVFPFLLRYPLATTSVGAFFGSISFLALGALLALSCRETSE